MKDIDKLWIEFRLYVGDMHVEDISEYIIIAKEIGIPLTFKTVGVARLAPSDTFDESIGRHLAQSKSHVKAYRKYSRLVNRLRQRICQDIAVFDETFSFATTLLDREEAHVKELKHCN